MTEFLRQYWWLANIVANAIWVPAMLATYYQAYKARLEAKAAREGTLHSRDCLEFVTGDGRCVNLVPLDTLHTLPRPGDVVLLPGHGVGNGGEFIPGAYLVGGVEHFYTQADGKRRRPQEARLTKAVAQVTSLNPPLTV